MGRLGLVVMRQTDSLDGPLDRLWLRTVRLAKVALGGVKRLIRPLR